MHASPFPRCPRRLTGACGAIALAFLAACGGGGGGAGSGPPAADVDPNLYSLAPTASLSTPNENVAVSHAAVTVNGAAIAYTATAGHLTANDANGAPEVSFFHVDYTADGADPATRPVTILFNGGPGSASAWLHLGSWGPRRISTGEPATTQTTFPWVENAESLLDTTDLVFVDAPGTGLSEAIAPHDNADFWGVDVDAAVFRDFVTRWLATHGRSAAPLFIYGESYGTVRAPLLVRLLETAGVPVAGLILQSSVLNYNSNCLQGDSALVNCAGALPTYSAVGTYWNLVQPPPTDPEAFLAGMRTYADTVYAPEVDAWIAAGGPAAPLPGADVDTLVHDTGLPAWSWDARFDMDYDRFRHDLIADTVLGVYDGRMSALLGTPLAVHDDPSNDYVVPPFTAEVNAMLPGDLGFTNPTTYVLASNAISYWNFSHAGLALPDVVPDLATALTLDPGLKVLAVGGEHDLITPFHQAELDLARLPPGAPVTFAFHAGGHMTYLDDSVRPLMKADLVAFYAAAAAAGAR
jgi:carboxypeptidase C (cathepsin A)